MCDDVALADQLEGVCECGPPLFVSICAFRHTTPHHTAPHRNVPLCTSPHLTSPHRATPHRTALQCTIVHHTAPHRTTPHHTAPHHTAPHLTSHPSIVHHTTPPSPPAPFLLCPSCLAVAALPTNGGMVTPGDMTPGAQNFYRGGYNMTSGGAAGMAVLQVGRAAAMAVLQGGGAAACVGGGAGVVTNSCWSYLILHNTYITT